eukprot:GHVU01178270.1.p1 GENE.GHVU01178270.1~~GHVU01178270.1.p1  ORF type:complete len:323 (-),score=52.31 GHVU01178270.1:563-1531(-)
MSPAVRTTLWTTVADVIDPVADRFLAWLNPSIPPRQGLTKGWALTKGSDALMMVMTYAAMVAYGYFVVRPRSKQTSPVADSPTAASPASSSTIDGGGATDARGRKFTSVSEKFQQEPWLIVQSVYNVVQVVLCAYMSIEAAKLVLVDGYKFACNPFDWQKPQSWRAVNLLFVFYMSKVLDFCDTAFIILRHKWRQMSFLHVYHHMATFFVYWINTNVSYDGDVFLTVALNGFVHVVMYSYYLLRTLNVEVPWKALVTQIQLFQFALMITQASWMLFFESPFPRRVTWVYIIFITTLIALFNDFRIKTYHSKKGEGKPQKRAD